MILLKKITLYYHTLRHLKFLQIRYQIYYRIKGIYYKKTGQRLPKVTPKVPLKTLSLQGVIITLRGYQSLNSFTFLNLSKKFKSSIDWNFNQYGKLWTYNLNYFDYLQQVDLSKEEGLRLIKTFIDFLPTCKDGLEPFPTSLRIQNWIKFLTIQQIKVEEIDQSLLAQLKFLSKNLEFHLLGNHLLENAFALLFGAYYFEDEVIFKKAEHILSSQLKEQILNDGGHFELSPMYHQLILFRVLDSINLIKCNPALFKSELLPFLLEKGQKMLGWLQRITFKSGEIPLLNDSTNGVAPTTKSLENYADKLGVIPEPLPLKESGYRKIEQKNYEVIIDVGKIGPDYIPGHAHSDIFNFVLVVNQQKIIVDTGISTYEKNKQRNLERSTSAHNTVQFGDFEQSQVWGGFRVGKRANITKLIENDYSIHAEHDGFRKYGATHSRKFTWESDHLIIEDTVETNKNFSSKAYFHFHPRIDIKIERNCILLDQAVIHFDNPISIEKSTYHYAPNFNKQIEAIQLIVHFSKNLTTYIQF